MGDFAAVLRAGGTLVLDGGLATELEARGCSLDDHLWSARLLQSDPDAIRSVHADFFRAGAQVCISASYQATVAGFAKIGISAEDSEHLLVRSVELVQQARSDAGPASIGCYGASLANGAEYTGDYEVDEEGLVEFHFRRMLVLASANPDVLACETIPGIAEARALVRCLTRLHERCQATSDGAVDGAPLPFSVSPPPAWISFACRDGSSLSSGEPFEDAVRAVASCPYVVAVGVNCTAPQHVAALIAKAREVTALPLVAYPNSGETWDAETKKWVSRGASELDDEFAGLAIKWHMAGARLVGGCCRTRPSTIGAVARALRTATTVATVGAAGEAKVVEEAAGR